MKSAGITRLLLLVSNLYLLLLLTTTVSAKPKGVSTVDELRAHYIDLEKALWEYLDKQTDRNSQLKKVYDSHRVFATQNLRRNFADGEYYILDRYYEWNLLQKDLINVDGLFEYFRNFVNQQNSVGEYDERAGLDIADTVLKDKQLLIPEIFQVIDNVMVKQTLYYRAMLDGREQICATKQSAQQFLFSLYSDISLTELKGYTMMQFSWMILRIYGKGNFSQEATHMREDFETRTQKTQALLREVMKRADRIVWTCDPQKHVLGETYDEVTRLLQGYIENEVDMNEDNTCRENCGHYQITKSTGCYKDLYCSRQQRCNGQLLNCQYFDSDMWICPSSTNSTRRYDYIEYENGRVLGKKGTCHRGTTKVDSWWRWLFWHCSYCFCMCDEQGLKSDRYFNLRPTVSNTTANMVVTGLRFKKHKRVFHIQIQEGELEKRGNINLSSLRWKPVEDYQIFDRGVRASIDYHTLAWDRKAIDLDDLTGDDPTHIVTGAKFRVVGTHLNLEVRLTEFDFESGKLIDADSNSFWKSNDNTDFSEEKRTQILLKNPDVPILSLTKSVPTSKTNQYIEFTHTDLDKDAGQNTVPYIDVQEVVSNPPVPLSGIGIYHKGRPEFGGFIAPKLITYDYTPHVESPSFSKK